VRLVSVVPLLFTAVLLACGATAAEEEEAATDDAALVEDRDAFYVIAHMTNTPDAVRWAAAEGANAVEIDVRFDEHDGTPRSVKHGGVCDCVCSLGDRDHVCAALARDCEASSSVPDVFEAIRESHELALVIIDSKIDGAAPIDVQRAAGARIVTALETGLFARGYRGKVVVGAPATDAIAYVRAAAAAATASKWSARISVGFDQMGKTEATAACTLDTLRSFTKRRAFGAGISACATGDFTPAIRAAAAQESAGESGLTYVWTLDNEASMRRYIDAGARGIITNKPGKLAAVVRAMGKTLARPETILASARSNDGPVEGAGPDRCGCDCDYHAGGCAIAKPAPPGYACKCEMAGAWRCQGKVTECSDRSSAACAVPDTSAAACSLGGGDCKGYPSG
jgi:hypothetical protein